jgi:hypothetical protein
VSKSNPNLSQLPSTWRETKPRVLLSELGWVIRSIWPEPTNSASCGQPISDVARVVVVVEDVVVDDGGSAMVVGVDCPLHAAARTRRQTINGRIMQQRKSD